MYNPHVTDACSEVLLILIWVREYSTSHSTMMPCALDAKVSADPFRYPDSPAASMPSCVLASGCGRWYHGDLLITYFRCTLLLVFVSDVLYDSNS